MRKKRVLKMESKIEKYKEYLLAESKKVLPFTIKDGKDYPRIDNELMCDDFLSGVSKVVLNNFEMYKENVLKAYIHYGETHYIFFMKDIRELEK